MEQAVAINSTKLQVWKLMEIAGILTNKKRRILMEELDRKFKCYGLESDEKMILAADRTYHHDKRERMKSLKQALKAWERKTQVPL